MAEVTKNVLKGYFTKGAVPTQSNYADFVDTMVSQSEMNTAISGVNSSVGNATSDIAKIAEILGKGQNETLTQLATKFAALTGNYANVYAFVSKVKAFLEDTDATDATINRWQEIEAFLQGITDTETLAGMLADLKSEIEGNLAVDSALSATSEKAVQNKVLFDELRIGGAYSIVNLRRESDGTSMQVAFDDIDANSLPVVNFNNTPVYVITKNTGRIINSSGKTFALSETMSCMAHFDSPSVNFISDVNGDTSDLLADIDAEKWYILYGNSGLATTAAEYVRTGINSVTKVTLIPETYSVVNYENSTVISLKEKVLELAAAFSNNYLKQISDMSTYTAAINGEIVQYIGQTNSTYIRGYFYEKTASGWENISVSPVIN